MRKVVAFIIIFTCLASYAFGQTNEGTEPPAKTLTEADNGETDNPGYFRSPGFLAISAGYTYHKGPNDRDSGLNPHVMGMLNIIQSEYGNLALSLSGTLAKPSASFDRGDVSYKIDATQYTGEIGLNYITASTSINFWIGAGYSYNYATADVDNFRNNGGVSAQYSQSFSEGTDGLFFHAGLEYILTKKGHLGMFILYRYSDIDRPEFRIDTDLNFGGVTQSFADNAGLSMSTDGFFFGVSYHF